MYGAMHITTTIRVRYAETDAMGVVHHASYIVWLEQGRTELLRASGTSYREIEARGFFAALTDLQVRYHAAARYDDEVVISTALVDVRSRQLAFTYTLRLANTGTLLVTARSEHVFVARATGRPARLPHDVQEALQSLHAPLSTLI
jgi:acyl-CoA thioester hydrolase